MKPMHREHGADDLAAKGPLADGLRRGLAAVSDCRPTGIRRGRAINCIP